MKHTVVHYIDSSDFGGAEQMVLTILQGLDGNKWRLVLIHHPDPGLKHFVETLNTLNLEVICLPRISSWRDFSAIASFTRKLREIKPSIFHAHLSWHLRCSYGIIVAYIARTPAVVATQHAFLNIKGRRQIVFQKLISLLVNRYIAVSHGIANRLKNVIFSSNKLIVIYNGINVDRFSIDISNYSIKELKKVNNASVILTVARINKIKGHADLIRAATLLPESVFLLVGEGSERVKFEEQVKKAGLEDRVIFLGHRDDIPHILARCDVFVLPSLYEGLPLTVLEAMAAEKPVVASNISGIDEVVIDGKTGLLVPPENHEALASAIESMISNPDYAKELGNAGRLRVGEAFSADVMVKRITDVYDELVGS
jgi:glycosyltransferase involved in cell wall biosynthesis